LLRVHFLNVGHGDCTIIEHPSGRLTMIDCNTSRDYDRESLEEYLAERRSRGGGIAGLAPLASYNPLTGALDSAAVHDLFGGMAQPPNPLAGAVHDIFGGMTPPPSPFAGAAQALGITPPPPAMDEEAKKELTDPVEFMLRMYSGRRLWRFVLTHPDLDHMRGIKRLYEMVGFDNFWDTAHTKPTPDFRSDGDREDWEFYQRLRSGVLGITPRNYHRGNRQFAFGMDENGLPGGDNIEILSPTPALLVSCNDAAKSNDLSYVLRVSHGGATVLLPGDAESEAWEEMVRFFGPRLKSDVLKASHHGRDSGFDLAAVQAIAPRVTVVSVGRKPETTDAHSKYHHHCGNVRSTRYHGNIVLEVDDAGRRRWLVDRNADTG